MSLFNKSARKLSSIFYLKKVLNSVRSYFAVNLEKCYYMSSGNLEVEISSEDQAEDDVV